MKNFEIRSIRPIVNIWNDVLEGDDFINSIVSIETSKNIREIAGTFSIVLKPMKGKYGIQSQENYWYDQFDPQDVVGITFHGDKYKEKGAQFLGIVDTPNKASSFRKDNPYRRTIIAGRDFGSLILDDDLVYAPEMFYEMNEDGSTNGEVAKVFGSDLERRIARNLEPKHPAFNLECSLAGFGPSLSTEKGIRTFADQPIAAAAKFILENASSIRNFVYRNKDGEIARKMIDFDTYVRAREGYVCMPSYSLSTYQGNLLNYVREVIDEKFNELFVDTKDGIAYIRLRPFPFDRKGDVVNHKIIDASDEFCWENLTRFYDDKTGPWEINENEVIEFKMSRSKKDVYSIFRINPVELDLGEQLKFMVMRAAIDLYNLLRFGLKGLTVDIRSTYKKKGEESLTKLVMECRDRLRNWYVNNPIYGCGTLQIKGREDIRVGDKVYLPWMKRKFHWKQTEDIEAKSMCKGFEYYVVGTKNRWQFGSTYETTLTLERGQNKRMLFSYEKERQATLKYIDENFDKLFKDMDIIRPPTISV